MRASRFVILLGVAVLYVSLTPRSPMAADADGVMMQNGKMMMKDGTKMQMKNGQTMTMNGKMMEGKMLEDGKSMGMGNQ